MTANNPETWELISRAYQVGNWHEAVRLARSLADGDPHSIGVRQLLAALYMQSANPRMALVQYERLLPLAVGEGDLFGALAAQKHLDRSHPEATRHAGRFAAMHKWFRSLGRQGLGERGEHAIGLTQPDLLGLPVELFSQAAEASDIESLGMSPRTISVRGGSVRVVLYGRVAWEIETADGRRLAPRTAHRGESIVVDPSWGEEVWLVLVPEAPSECLCFESDLLNDMIRVVPALEALLRDPKRLEEASSHEGTERPTEHSAPGLMLVPTPAPATEGFAPVEFGLVDLSRIADLGVDDGETPDPSERSLLSWPDEESPINRRRDPRVEVGLISRVAILGIAGLGLETLRGRLVDLSISGMGIKFPREQINEAYEALENSLVSVELEFPAPLPSLTLAGRVRHLRHDQPEGGVMVGVEFVLATELDRTRLLDAVNQAEGRDGRAA